MVMYIIDRRGGVQKSYTRTDPPFSIFAKHKIIKRIKTYYGFSYHFF